MSTSLENNLFTLEDQELTADSSGVILTPANLSQYCETFAAQNNPVNKQFSADTTDNGNNPKNKTERFTSIWVSIVIFS